MKINHKLFLECEPYFQITLQEITVSLDISKEMIYEIIDEGIVGIETHQQHELIFDNQAYSRIHTVIKLHRDLGINFAGAALALELMDEINELKNQLHHQSVK